jgi:hypothetical protein
MESNAEPALIGAIEALVEFFVEFCGDESGITRQGQFQSPRQQLEVACYLSPKLASALSSLIAAWEHYDQNREEEEDDY